MKGDVLILAEHAGEEIDPITLQLLGKGKELADRLGCRVNALLLGDNLDTPAQLMRGLGFDTVLVADHPGLKLYNPQVYSQLIAGLVRDAAPRLFLLGYTYLGMEVGPAVATRLGVGLVSNCVDLELLGDQVTVTRPMYGGAVYTKVKIRKALPTIISIPKGALPMKMGPERTGTVVRINVRISEADMRTRVLGSLIEPEGGSDLKRADVIVAVGRGIGERSNLRLIEELADALGGAVACSRPLVDSGYLPPGCQVGTGGKTVRPKVYIACGISGASQHVAGMGDSQMIIAINKDPKAPIFRVARYGVVGDLFEVIPALVAESKKLRRRALGAAHD